MAVGPSLGRTSSSNNAALLVGANLIRPTPYSYASFANVNLGFRTSSGSIFGGSGNSPFTGTSKYLLFKFNNSGTTNYGWVEIKQLTQGNTVSDWTATVGLMAYDNTGALLAPGDVGGSNNAVPEPATAAMFAMGGALVLGARGLRRWREQRATAAAESLSS